MKRKQRGAFMALKPTTSTLRVRRATHCASRPLNVYPIYAMLYCTATSIHLHLKET